MNDDKEMARIEIALTKKEIVNIETTLQNKKIKLKQLREILCN